MSFLEAALGAIAAPAYALYRSKIAFLPLYVGAWLALLAGAAYAAFRGWRAGFTCAHAAAIALCLLGLALLGWAHRRRYLIFRACAPPDGEPARELVPEERLRVRASGLFEVSGMRRYLVEVPAVFWTTGLAEHIVAAHVQAANLLGVGVPGVERGWWYVFIEPRRVRHVEPGELCFGLHARPAVRVTLDEEGGPRQLHLSCNDAAAQARLLRELQKSRDLARRAHAL